MGWGHCCIIEKQRKSIIQKGLKWSSTVHRARTVVAAARNFVTAHYDI